MMPGAEMDPRVHQIAQGLWRWTAAHADWSSNAEPNSTGGWPQEVGSVLYEAEEAAIFFDPLPPPDPAPFWRWADHRCAGRRVMVLTTIGWHRRSRPEFVERYQATSSRARRNLPAGVESFIVRGAGETMFWLPGHRTLIPGDRILAAAGGGLRLCPDSWMRYLSSPLTGEQLRHRWQDLLEPPVERVLVSHGEPVLTAGRKVLAQLLTG